MNIGFAGMGHMGLVNAAVMAERGHTVFAWDPDPLFVSQLAGRTQGEPGLMRLLEHEFPKTGFWSTDISFLGQCEVVYITVDVEKHLTSTLDQLRDLIQQVLSAIKDDTLLIITSQVPPGFTRSIAGIPAHQLFYQMDTLVFGNAIDRARVPQQVTFGTADMAVHPKVLTVLDQLTTAPGAPPTGVPIYVTTYENAELAKMAINCYLAAAISMSDTLAMLAPSLGADWQQVVGALDGDTRVGTYVQPGLGIGGGHLMRDVHSLAALERGRSEFLGAIIDLDGHMKFDYVGDVLVEAGLDPTRDAVALWGLAYKPGTRCSTAGPALGFILGAGWQKIHVHDPLVHVDFDENFANLVMHQYATPMSAAEGARALVVTTPWPEYRDVPLTAVRRVMVDAAVLVDPYRLLSRAQAEDAGFTYLTLGA